MDPFLDHAIEGFEMTKPEGPVPVELQWKLCEDMQAPIAQWCPPELQSRRHHARVDAEALRAAYQSLCGM